MTFCLGQPGLTRFIEHPDLTQIMYWITALIMCSGPDQNNKLNLLDGDDGTISPGDIWKD